MLALQDMNYITGCGFILNIKLICSIVNAVCLFIDCITWLPCVCAVWQDAAEEQSPARSSCCQASHNQQPTGYQLGQAES